MGFWSPTQASKNSHSLSFFNLAFREFLQYLTNRSWPSLEYEIIRLGGVLPSGLRSKGGSPSRVLSIVFFQTDRFWHHSFPMAMKLKNFSFGTKGKPFSIAHRSMPPREFHPSLGQFKDFRRLVADPFSPRETTSLLTARPPAAFFFFTDEGFGYLPFLGFSSRISGLSQALFPPFHGKVGKGSPPLFPTSGAVPPSFPPKGIPPDDPDPLFDYLYFPPSSQNEIMRWRLW